jgi:endonuclease YncB( thermonuclease family)
MSDRLLARIIHEHSLSKNQKWLAGCSRAVSIDVMMKHHILTGFVLVLVAAYPTLAGADFVARVVTVHEGDRLTIRHDGRSEIIYLQDVDCPELKQPYGKQARLAMAAYVGNRDVVVQSLKRDRHGRTTAVILLPDKRNVAHELVKEGLAWLRPDMPQGQSLGEVEQLARAERKGLWSEPNPVPPWKWNGAKKTSRKSPN